MKPRINPSRSLLDLAEAQAGVLSVHQTRLAGLPRTSLARLVRNGLWLQLGAGLYLAAATEPTWLALAWSGVLLGGDRARLGGEAAGHRCGLIDEAPAEISVWIPHGSTRVDRPPWRFRREVPGFRLPSRGAPPLTQIEDTVLDLLEVLTERDVVPVVTRAVQHRRTTPARIARRLRERGRCRHRRLVDDLLADVAEGAESPLEVAYFRRVERAHGLPRGRRQHRNRRGHHRDVWYEAYRTVVELDGRLGHEGPARFRDMERDNLAALDGDATLRFGWSDVSDRPCEVAWQVGVLLRLRGWSGEPTRCPSCRHVR